jgi:hypothetical protein
MLVALCFVAALVGSESCTQVVFMQITTSVEQEVEASIDLPRELVQLQCLSLNV